MLQSKLTEDGIIEERALNCAQFVSNLNALKTIEVVIAVKALVKTTSVNEITKAGLEAMRLPQPEKNLLYTV